MNVMEIPNSKSGAWEVSEFEVGAYDIENIRLAFQPGGRTIRPGKYKRLTRNSKVVMSNTPSEISDLSYFIYKAEGNVLINGLGLGVALAEILKKEEVTSVTVIEIEEDVIKLVAPFFKDDSRVSIIRANALTWIPPKGIKYDVVWHDIWEDICVDNLETMGQLHRKYGRRSKWQGSWCRDLCMYYRNRDKRNSWY